MRKLYIKVQNVGDEEELWAAIRERDIIIDKRTEALEDALDKIEDLEKELNNKELVEEQ